VAEIPDLAGKIDGQWSFVNGLAPVAGFGDGYRPWHRRRVADRSQPGRRFRDGRLRRRDAPDLLPRSTT
jgi:hypothetical protein